MLNPESVMLNLILNLIQSKGETEWVFQRSRLVFHEQIDQ